MHTDLKTARQPAFDATRVAVLLAAAVMLSGCLSGSRGGAVDKAKLEEGLNRFLGKDIEEVVSRVGYPHQEITAPNGNKVFVYSESRSYTAPTTSVSSQVPVGGSVTSTSGKVHVPQKYDTVTSTYAGQTSTSSCLLFFEVDKDNTVIRWSYQGSLCCRGCTVGASKPFQGKDSNPKATVRLEPE